MSAEVLSRAALNRALLDRQLLLRRVPLPAGGSRAGQVIETVEHLVGLQAQARSRPTTGCGPGWRTSGPRTWPTSSPTVGWSGSR